MILTLSPLEFDKHKHLLEVQSIEPILSDKSLISNFSAEIQRNYFDELNTILSNATFASNSSYIQIVDGFKKDLYSNSHGQFARIFNWNKDKFAKDYETTSKEVESLPNSIA